MEIIDCLVRISKLVLMCFQCIPSLKFRVEGFVKFRQILSSGITDHHDEQLLLASFNFCETEDQESSEA